MKKEQTIKKTIRKKDGTIIIETNLGKITIFPDKTQLNKNNP